MLKNGKKQGTVRFTVSPACAARRAFLAGDFTDWEPMPMQKRKGTFGVTLPLDAGTYQYKFLIDEQWMTDPDHDEVAVSPLGTVNSVAVVT
jgi:1,4-alpha-glucan branching enzyme